MRFCQCAKSECHTKYINKERRSTLYENQFEMLKNFLRALNFGVRLMKDKYKLLLIDDDELIAESVGEFFKMEGYQATIINKSEQAIEYIENRAFDLIITDLVMDKVDGIQILRKVKEVSPETKVIILTGYGDLGSAIHALRNGASDYLLKPCEYEELLFRVERCLEKLEIERKLKFYEKILPVCCMCKKIRDDAGKEPGTGHWMSMEEYIHHKAKVNITSTYCPRCAQELMKDIDKW